MPPTTLFSRIMENKYFSSTTRITLEPFIITFIFVWFLMDGAQIQKNLLMWKICKFQLNQTEIVCGNLSAYNETQSEVQTRANNFEMFGQFMTTIPTIIYSFFAGSLSDDYGRKPLIILPTFGVVIGMFLSIVNYEFIDTLPIEFFYISGSCWWFFFGWKRSLLFGSVWFWSFYHD